MCVGSQAVQSKTIKRVSSVGLEANPGQSRSLTGEVATASASAPAWKRANEGKEKKRKERLRVQCCETIRRPSFRNKRVSSLPDCSATLSRPQDGFRCRSCLSPGSSQLGWLAGLGWLVTQALCLLIQSSWEMMN